VHLKNCGLLSVAVLSLFVTGGCSQAPRGPSVAPAAMPRIGTVDERFQSFNIEMVEVTGGRFWKPYKDIAAALKEQPSAAKAGASPAGVDPRLFQQRPPVDLGNARLRKLAAALAPAYVRVSGTWANSTFFHDSDTPAPSKPPQGFGGILTRAQWKGVVDFSRAANTPIVTSFATSAGTRDARGLWTPKEANKLLAYTKSIGGAIAAAEFMNEPTIAALGGAPKGYGAAAFGRDLAVFRPFIKQAAPDLVLLGPGSVGEGVPLGDPSSPRRMPFLKSEDLLAAAGPVFDAFSYHFYGAVSNRCATLGAGASTTPDAALSEDWLSRTDKVEEFYRGLRDRFQPGKPLWLTETGGAACGGNPWDSTFLDSFRYLDQLGRLAKRGVQVVAHNTLAASDYGLIDETSLEPRPNYWAALLWRNLMGPVVLDAGASPSPALHLYAHCLRGSPGGVALLAINTDRTAAQSFELAAAARRYTLSAAHLEDARVLLNGSELKLGPDDAIPPLSSAPAPSGRVTFDPATITFLALPDANNPSCR
jgi:heparanase 1